MQTKEIIVKLMTAQQSLAEVRAHIKDGQDVAELGYMLNKIPAMIARIEKHG